MIAQHHFDEFDIGNRYGLDYACYWLCRERPLTIRLVTQQPETALAAATRLAWANTTFYVDTKRIATAFKQQFGVKAIVKPHQKTDAALVLFSRQNNSKPPIAKRVVVMAHNRLSYKTALYPRLDGDQVWNVHQWFKTTCEIDGRAGLFTPGFLLRWAGSLIAGSRRSERHFQLGQQAMDSLINTGPLWWLGYVIILAGKERT